MFAAFWCYRLTRHSQLRLLLFLQILTHFVSKQLLIFTNQLTRTLPVKKSYNLHSPKTFLISCQHWNCWWGFGFVVKYIVLWRGFSSLLGKMTRTIWSPFVLTLLSRRFVPTCRHFLSNQSCFHRLWCLHMTEQITLWGSKDVQESRTNDRTFSTEVISADWKVFLCYRTFLSISWWSVLEGTNTGLDFPNVYVII